MKKYLIAAGVGATLILAYTAAAAASGAAALLNDSDSSPAEATAAVAGSAPTTADLTPARHTAGSADTLTDAVEATVLPAGSAGASAVPVPDRLAVPAPAWNAALSSATQDDDSHMKAVKEGANDFPVAPALATAAVVGAAVAVASNDSAQSG
jgi:hypothetical protein